jgi:hypothetical protein
MVRLKRLDPKNRRGLARVLLPALPQRNADGRLWVGRNHGSYHYRARNPENGPPGGRQQRATARTQTDVPGLVANTCLYPLERQTSETGPSPRPCAGHRIRSGPVPPGSAHTGPPAGDLASKSTTADEIPSARRYPCPASHHGHRLAPDVNPPALTSQLTALSLNHEPQTLSRISSYLLTLPHPCKPHFNILDLAPELAAAPPLPPRLAPAWAPATPRFTWQAEEGGPQRSGGPPSSCKPRRGANTTPRGGAAACSAQDRNSEHNSRTQQVSHHGRDRHDFGPGPLGSTSRTCLGSVAFTRQEHSRLACVPAESTGRIARFVRERTGRCRRARWASASRVTIQRTHVRGVSRIA